MKSMIQHEIWLITGSQHLYGEAILKEVARHAQIIAERLSASEIISANIVYQPIVTTAEEISQVCSAANNHPNCMGIITWMHTFSPAKMWINGLKILSKPLLHLHTQFNKSIPWDSMDMDFMNLNQSAHGDREFGFICTRMKIRRKVVVGHWEDPEVHHQILDWARAARGWQDWQGAKFVRFGDNMRNVAVTEGDKVEAEIKFGFSVNTFGVGDLVSCIQKVEDREIFALVDQYEMLYDLVGALKRGGEKRNSLIEAARIELGLENFLVDGGYKGFSNTFEDLHGMRQLPGIAVQRLMNKGYGYAGEGDWKTMALVRAMKVMGQGYPGGNAFMEDYTYDFEEGGGMVLGSHMLEVDECLADGKPSCEVHPLGIGGKEDPVRLVFNAKGGPALNASLVDMGSRFRMVIQAVESVAPLKDLPQLPVARTMWKPLPDFKTGCAAWILAGGAHHTCFSQNITKEVLLDFAEMAGIEVIVIDEKTEIRKLKQELIWSDTAYGLKP